MDCGGGGGLGSGSGTSQLVSSEGGSDKSRLVNCCCYRNVADRPFFFTLKLGSQGERHRHGRGKGRGGKRWVEFGGVVGRRSWEPHWEYIHSHINIPYAYILLCQARRQVSGYRTDEEDWDNKNKQEDEGEKRPKKKE